MQHLTRRDVVLRHLLVAPSIVCTWFIRLFKRTTRTNRMHYLISIYFNN